MSGCDPFPRSEDGWEIEATVVADLLARRASPDGPQFVLLDCREEEEHAFCRIGGDVLVPLNRLANEVDRVLPESDVPVVVYCHHGMRSARAAQFLRSHGWLRAFSLRGGIDAWSTEVDASILRY